MRRTKGGSETTNQFSLSCSSPLSYSTPPDRNTLLCDWCLQGVNVDASGDWLLFWNQLPSFFIVYSSGNLLMYSFTDEKNGLYNLWANYSLYIIFICFCMHKRHPMGFKCIAQIEEQVDKQRAHAMSTLDRLARQVAVEKLERREKCKAFKVWLFSILIELKKKCIVTRTITQD